MILIMRTLSLVVLAVAVLALAACRSGDDGYASLEGATDEAVSDKFGAVASGAEAALPTVGFREGAPAGIVAQEEPAFAPPPLVPAPPERADASDVGGDSTVFEEEVATLVSLQRIIVRTVNMQIEVADVSASLDDVADLAREMDGWVVSSNLNQRHRGFVSIRVPAGRLDDTVLRLRDMAVAVESVESTSKDVTDEFVDTTARLKNLEATEAALIRLLDKAETVEDALNVQRELTRVQGDIESRQGRINLLKETSAFSLVNVTLEEEPAEMLVDAGVDHTSGVGQIVRFRAFFKPPEGTDRFTFTWDFGDGSRVVTSDHTAPTADEDTRVTATVAHVYSDDRDSPFFAEVTIAGTGDAGLAEGDDIQVITVTRVPTIEVFAGENITQEEGQNVEFSGSFTRPEGVTDVEFRWEFGDGAPPATGEIQEGITNALATHVYPDHRPFPFTATLTITAESEAGQVESSSSVRVTVIKAEGWTIAGWSAGDEGRSAVRVLSRIGQWIATAVIWLAIFSPIWAVGVIVGVIAWRRTRASAQSHVN